MKDQPWVERYRPASLANVTGQEETVSILSKSIQSMNVRILNDLPFE
jgi:DNA polymerase III gamma/tau subunit